MMKKIKLIIGMFIYSFLYYFPSPYLPIIGKISSFLRSLTLNFINPNINIRTIIGKRCYLGNPNNLSLGFSSSLGNDFVLHNAKVFIGQQVMIASNVLIMGGGHIFSRTDIPMIKQGNIGKTNLIIEDNVWIGTRTLILAKDIVIGEGAIIGAGSVVTKSIPKNSIVAGNPAKVIRIR